jgi:hypothetical protein
MKTGRRSRAGILLALSRRRSMRMPELGFSCGLILASSAVGCGNDEAALIVAERARFRELAPEQYVIAACGTGPGGTCTREVVIGGRVVTAELAAASDRAWRPVAELGAWVDQVSSMFDAALEESGSLRALEFEPRWHYVSEYQPDASGAGRRVTCFLPDRVDLQQCQAAGEATDAP